MFSFATGDVFREPQGHGFSAFLLSDEKKHFLDGLLVGEALVLLHWFHVVEVRMSGGTIGKLGVAVWAGKYKLTRPQTTRVMPALRICLFWVELLIQKHHEP